jgi:hypothetical protein
MKKMFGTFFLLFGSLGITCILLVFIRITPLHNYCFDHLNCIGLQLGNHIYTPVTTIQHPTENWIDLIFLRTHQKHLHGYSFFHHQYFAIEMHHVPVGHKLIYHYNNQNHDLPYMKGTPFRVKNGQLILYKRRRKGIGFILEKVAKSTSWPIK